MKWVWCTLVAVVILLGGWFWWNREPEPLLRLDGNASPVRSAADGPGQAPDKAAPSRRTLVDRPLELTGRQQEQEARQKLDPRADGWDTEEIHQRINRQLKRLAAALERPAEEALWDKVRETAAADFESVPLRPEELTSYHPADWLTVQVADPERLQRLEPRYRGPSGLEQALRSLLQQAESWDEAHGKFKVVRVKLRGAQVRTKLYYEFHARRGNRSLEQHATWWCSWHAPNRNRRPRLQSIRLEAYQESRSELPGGVLLVDCTRDALRNCPQAVEQFRYGLNHWTRRISKNYGLGIAERFGLAVGDVNGDGRDDLFVCQPAGLPHRLLVQQPDGRFADRTAEAGLDLLDPAVSALLVDLDNDGNQDLVLACPFQLLWFSNDGTGKFRLRFRYELPSGDSHALTALDFDGDADLDVFFTVGEGADKEVPFDYFDAVNGGANYLFRNDIDRANKQWKFVDVTREVGLTRDQNRHTLAAAWEDIDNDGDLDLYVANDYGPNTLYRNDGGRFTAITQQAGVEDPGSGMSVSWADFDHDGRMDLYVANMFSSAGNRITTQQQKLAQYDAEKLARIQRFAKGNSLFRNVDGTRFQEVSQAAGVEVARWAWCSLFVDLNNDTWEDLVVANGYITNDKPDDL